TALLPGAHLHDLFGRHHDVAELLFHLHAHDAVAQRLGHRLLEAGIGMHHVPALDDLAIAFHRLSHLHQLPSSRRMTHWITRSKPASIRLMITTTSITTQL